MESYETEEQQVEAIKKWWRENYKLIIIVFVVGISSILGFQFYQENKIMMEQAASDNFNALLDASQNQQNAIIADRAQLLQKDFHATPYVDPANLILAANLLKQGEHDKALEKISRVISAADDPVLKEIAIINKSKILLAMDKADDALKLLTDHYDSNSALSAVNLELQGDIDIARGHADTAKAKYDEALAKYLLAGMNVEFLRLKRSDLGN